MNLNEIIGQCLDDSHEWFPDHAGDVAFLTLALCGETGELANLVKKIVRRTHTGEELQDKIEEEVVDVFIYLMNIVGLFEQQTGFDLVELYKAKRDENVLRFHKGRISELEGL